MTVKDVARLAGASPSAVSRYFNNGPLSQQKRAAIQAVIEKTGYYPNQAAHTLRTGRVRQVGVLVPRIHSEAVSQVTSGIAETLDRQGYLPVLGATLRDTDREARYLEIMRAFHVAGMILMASTVTEELTMLYRACPVPLVITGQRIPGFNCVFHDDFNAMRELALRMIRRGRRKFAYIGVDDRDIAVGRERLRGAREALYNAGRNAEEMPVAMSDFDWESGRARMRELLANFPETDAVLCATDTIAQGAMLALREAGRRVPEDVSIAGIGDDWTDLISVPQMTAARLSQTRCGREAASILLRLLEHPASGPWQIMLGYQIVDRGSI